LPAELARARRGGLASGLNPLLPALYSWLIGLVGLGVLAYLVLAGWSGLPWLAILIFAALSVLVQRSSFHLNTAARHSLAGVIDVASILALGPVAGSVVAAGSGLAYLELRALRHGDITRRDLLDTPLFNAGLKALTALVAGSLYVRLGGIVPPSILDWRNLLAALAVCLTWFVLDQAGWAVLDALHGGRDAVALFAPAGLRQALAIELLPLPFGLILALGYAHLDPFAFFLMALAVVVVAVLAQRWADTRTELVRRVAELSTMEEIGRAIAKAQLDVDELCRLMYEHATRLVDTTIFHLGLFEGDTYAIKLLMQNGVEEPARRFQLAPGVGLVGWLRQTKQPILVRDFTKEIDRLPAKPIYAADTPPRSAVFVPMLAGDIAIGTLSIQSFRPNAYDQVALRILSAMADQAAVAIQKARLYNREVRRARELETIGAVSAQVTATLELDQVFRRVVQLIRENFDYYHVAVFTADSERRVVSFQVSSSASGRDVAVEVSWGQGLVGWVAEHRQAALVNDVERDDRYRCVDALEETRSEITVPLLLEPELVGVLDVQSDQLDAFGPDDLFILSTLSDQIAAAIQQARLYESGRQQAWFSTALLQVADATSRLSDMDEVLASIVRLTPLLAGVDRCAILSWDESTASFVPGQTYGLEPELREIFASLRFGSTTLPALDVVRAEKQPVLVTAAESALLPPHLVEMFDIREMLLLPLLAQGELLGAMMVDYGGLDHPFTGRMINMLTGIANQAAMVIHSARLVQAQQEEAYVSTALLQVAETVSRSVDLGESLAAIVRITPLLVGVDLCAVFLRDRAGGTYLPAQQYGLARERAAAFGELRLSADHPMVRDLLGGEPLVAVADDAEGATAAALRRVFGDEQPLLALPLVAKSDVVGLMIVDYRGSMQHFAQRWLNILTGIASQTAIAVENDRLQKETAEQERIRQELDVARRIQASFLPDSCPQLEGWEVAALWRSARQVGGDFYDFIALPPRLGGQKDSIGGSELRSGKQDNGPANQLGLVIADVADKGVPAALYMALTRTLIRTVAFDGASPARTLARANNLILADARAELFVTAFYAILDAGTGRVRYANGGHMPAIVIRAGGGESTLLRAHGMALGILRGVLPPEETAKLEPGDTLILYTDGVVEATDGQEQMFGREQLVEVAERHRRESPAAMVQAISDAIAAFVGDAPQFDDLTLVVARREPAPGAVSESGLR
jgi:serine phosphatase RsbU (regulator of sigma subunit)/putative methionine-R-sulfoxide reductase with GAF domain